ncbi:hypothetical protein BDZ89DRAFT_1138597 [Hymenopellis radicata]|nr:hypothetical protein BDZ89DRAFT_1138597 [Hymenopellis radicata]
MPKHPTDATAAGALKKIKSTTGSDSTVASDDDNMNTLKRPTLPMIAQSTHTAWREPSTTLTRHISPVNPPPVEPRHAEPSEPQLLPLIRHDEVGFEFGAGLTPLPFTTLSSALSNNVNQMRPSMIATRSFGTMLYSLFATDVSKYAWLPVWSNSSSKRIVPCPTSLDKVNVNSHDVVWFMMGQCTHCDLLTDSSRTQYCRRSASKAFTASSQEFAAAAMLFGYKNATFAVSHGGIELTTGRKPGDKTPKSRPTAHGSVPRPWIRTSPFTMAQLDRMETELESGDFVLTGFALNGYREKPLIESQTEQIVSASNILFAILLSRPTGRYIDKDAAAVNNDMMDDTPLSVSNHEPIKTTIDVPIDEAPPVERGPVL